MLKIKNLFKKKNSPTPNSLVGEKTTESTPELIQVSASIAECLNDKEAEYEKLPREQSGSSTTMATTPNTYSADLGSDGTILEIPLQNRKYVSVQEPHTEEEQYEDDKEYVSESDSSLEDEEPEAEFPEQLELLDYKLINKVGEGAFSKVYRAIPQQDRSRKFLTKNYKQVAVKVISKQELTSQSNTKNKTSTKEQVLKEITIHKTVSSCENIVSFVDFQETGHFYFIIQELLSGGEVFGEIVRLTYFSEDLSRHVIRQLALAVKHMHSLGIVHRDIKPENLLFEPIEFIPSPNRKFRKSDDPGSKQDEGVFRPGIGGGGIGIIKLADFGLSKQIYSTNTKTPCGTVGYTAPEVVKDERYSMKVDMWGIGCVLYTVLCGFPPFYDEKIDVLTEKISRGEYTFLRPWWDEISDSAKNAVRRLLEVNPEKRYDIDEFLNDPWLNSYDCLRDQMLKKHKSESMENVQSTKEKKRHQTSHRHRKLFKRDSSLLYSPAAVAMRDAFDISNAVQRIEGDKRMTPAGINLGSLQEDDEFELEQNMFHLKLNSSTIIKRRKNKDKVKIPMIVNE